VLHSGSSSNGSTTAALIWRKTGPTKVGEDQNMAAQSRFANQRRRGRARTSSPIGP
jgi:hypothetical protein